MAGTDDVSMEAENSMIGATMPMSGTESQTRIVETALVPPLGDESTEDMARYSTLWIKIGSRTPKALRAQTLQPIISIVPTHYLNYHLAKCALHKNIDVTLEWVRKNFAPYGVLHTDKRELAFQDGKRVLTIDKQNYYGTIKNLCDNTLTGGDVLWCASSSFLVRRLTRAPQARHQAQENRAQHHLRPQLQERHARVLSPVSRGRQAAAVPRPHFPSDDDEDQDPLL